MRAAARQAWAVVHRLQRADVLPSNDIAFLLRACPLTGVPVRLTSPPMWDGGQRTASRRRARQQQTLVMRRIVAPRRRAGCAALTISSVVVLRDGAAVPDEQDACCQPGQPPLLGATRAGVNTKAVQADYRSRQDGLSNDVLFARPH